MQKLNKEWHLAHKMPIKPTLDQRLEWHVNHFKNCKCREMPKNIYELAVKKSLISIK